MPLIKLNDRSIKDVTSLPFGVGNLIHIQSQTASNSASISFTTGINSTYKEYQFYFIDIHPRTDNVTFTFNGSTDGTNYNVTKTSTFFGANNLEDGSYSALNYYTDKDLAQSTSFQMLSYNALGNASDESYAGSMQLFNPSSSTYVKHFIANGSTYYFDGGELHTLVAGYMNTTSPITACQFKMDSGNFDGTIALFGVL
jgi:hypothetical protein